MVRLMDVELEIGTCLRTRFRKELRVVDRLGEGAQGIVYSVIYNGRPMALKWYRPGSFYDRQGFIDNLYSNIISGSPTDSFLWPLDLVEVAGGGFGYVMELCPEGYVLAKELFLHPDLFPSFRRAIDACLGVVSAFRVLHYKGYCYQDVSGGNFFVDPVRGKVLICDNDNVVPVDTETGIRGTPRFMAPEIVVENSVPSVQSDRHSLAVLIFMLLCAQHPLEGVRFTRADELDPATQRRIYGTDPVFVMDPTNVTNRPDPAYPNVLKVWPYLPDHMKSIFVRAFSREALTNPSRRPKEYDWIRELTRFRSEVVNCVCGNEVFMENARPVPCDSPTCGRQVRVALRAKMADYALPFTHDMRLYRVQTCVCNPDAALDLLAWVTRANERADVLGITNMGREPWGVSQGGSTHAVMPQQTIVAIPDMELLIKDVRVHIGRNV